MLDQLCMVIWLTVVIAFVAGLVTLFIDPELTPFTAGISGLLAAIVTSGFFLFGVW